MITSYNILCNSIYYVLYWDRRLRFHLMSGENTHQSQSTSGNPDENQWFNSTDLVKKFVTRLYRDVDNSSLQNEPQVKWVFGEKEEQNLLSTYEYLWEYLYEIKTVTGFVEFSTQLQLPQWPEKESNQTYWKSQRYIML